MKVAVEWLLDVGDVVCTERRAWKRVYDLPERALAPEVLADEPTTRRACGGWWARPASRSAWRRSAT